MYYEEYHRIEDAFHREKQVQRWSSKKKEALINSLTGFANYPGITRSFLIERIDHHGPKGPSLSPNTTDPGG